MLVGGGNKSNLSLYSVALLFGQGLSIIDG